VVVIQQLFYPRPKFDYPYFTLIQVNKSEQSDSNCTDGQGLLDGGVSNALELFPGC
jgi:hypothetical protein